MSTRIIIDGADFTVNGIDVMTNSEKTAIVESQMANAKWIDGAVFGAQNSQIGNPIFINSSTYRSCIMIQSDAVYKERDIIRNTTAGDGCYCLAIPKGCKSITNSMEYTSLNFSMLAYDEDANLLKDTGWKNGGSSYSLDTTAWSNNIFYVCLNISGLIPSGETLASIGYSLTASFD